ncbi:eisosome protein SEG2-like [Macadamia integrifolia]|uniref:eisosome protein SEG2-like n=1 Tax=Macadamia integrifolia TaxID=60698 RepID=UPI001C4FE291|nr:eisosome protein SEG2-like [Macadamia integrifolia]XP_042507013.1 eisosome protein SEG2-like [Macadamia integrifolia]
MASGGTSNMLDMTKYNSTRSSNGNSESSSHVAKATTLSQSNANASDNSQGSSPTTKRTEHSRHEVSKEIKELVDLEPVRQQSSERPNYGSKGKRTNVPDIISLDDSDNSDIDFVYDSADHGELSNNECELEDSDEDNDLECEHEKDVDKHDELDDYDRNVYDPDDFEPVICHDDSDDSNFNVGAIYLDVNEFKVKLKEFAIHHSFELIFERMRRQGS